MALQRFRVGDYGVDVVLTVKEDGVAVDISGATIANVVFRKPVSGTSVTKIGDFYTDGTDGKILYVVEQGLFDEEGLWQIQAHLALEDFNGKSYPVVFAVDEVL